MGTTGGSTKQLKPVLGFWDLMGASLGQIIGAGIMTLLGSALAITGRSAPLTLGIAAIFTICQILPMLYISGTVRLRGGNYTTIAMLCGKTLAGAFSIIFVFTNLSLSMYALSFASYFISLFGFGSEKVIGMITLTLFFVLNLMGIDKFAKIQNLIVSFLVIALALFAAMGVSKIAPGYYEPDTFMIGGLMGLFQAGALLSFATGGATVIMNLSAEAKNPTKDIPRVMLISTLAVAALYAVIGFVAAGVLPLDQVADQNLSLVAKVIFPKPLYVFFMICGAGFALISTLNSQLATAPKALMQACDDGWLPASIAKLNKHRCPVVILSALYVVATVCILSGLSVSILGSMCQVASGLTAIAIPLCTWRLPDVAPDAWEVSKFKTSRAVLKTISVIGTISAVLKVYLNFTRLSTTLKYINIVVLVAALAYAVIKGRKITMEISYEKA